MKTFHQDGTGVDPDGQLHGTLAEFRDVVQGTEDILT
jgi:hypothetical protein